MKIFKKLFFVFIVMTSACSGQTLVNGVDASESESLKTLEVVAVHHDVVDDAASSLEVRDGTKEFVNDLGVTINLAKAYLGWGHVFLISEGDDEDCIPGFDTELHVESVEDIMAEDLVGKVLGAEEIQDVSYCQYALEFSPSHDAMIGNDFIPEIENRSAYVSGTWNSGTLNGTFEIFIEDSFETEMMVFSSSHEGANEPHPLHFHEEEHEAELVLGNKYTHWFEGIDFSEAAEELSEKLKENIKAKIHQHHGEITVSDSETESGGHTH